MPTVIRTPAPASRRPARPKGIIKAVVAVTGVEDQVSDIITPGIFAATLRKRRPKVVFHHDFKDFAGRIISIEEWLPGDARLPRRQPNGEPWPPMAGALVATMQFNMNAARGREVYEWARFYAETGEAAWSIGYTVPNGMWVKRGGIRHILGIDLFEVSLVLHGAHPLTMALEVKSTPAALAVNEARGGYEVKGNPGPIGTPGNRENWVDQVGGLPPYIREIAHALIREGHDDSAAIAMGVAAVKRWAVGGDDVEPDTRTKALAALAEWEAKKAAAHADNVLEHKQAPVAHLGLKAAGLAVKAADTGRVLLLQRAIDDDDPASGTWEFPGGHIEDEESPALAAHREWEEEVGISVPDGVSAGTWDSPNGVYRGHIHVVPVEADVPTNVTGGERQVLNPDDPDQDHIETVAWFNVDDLPLMPSLREEVRQTPWDLLRGFETKSAAGAVLEAKTLHHPTPIVETKMTALTGSYEEVRGLISAAASKKFVEKKDRDHPDCWVNVEATFPKHAIVSIFEKGEPRTLMVPYLLTDDGVELGSPSPVRVEAVPTGEHVGPEVLALAPAIASIEQVTGLLRQSPLETKGAGTALRPPLMDLMDALFAKGFDLDDLAFGQPGDEPADVRPGSDEDPDDLDDADDLDEDDEDDEDDDAPARLLSPAELHARAESLLAPPRAPEVKDVATSGSAQLPALGGVERLDEDEEDLTPDAVAAELAALRAS